MFGTASIPNRPTGKLALAAILLSSCLALRSFTDLLTEDLGDLGLPTLISLAFPSCVLLFGIFRSSAFQWVAGFAAVALALMSGVRVLANIMTHWGSTKPLLVTMDGKNVYLLCLALGISYLLLFDKEVAAYRRQLAVRFPDKDSLDPKVDNLPDDPINPS